MATPMLTVPPKIVRRANSSSLCRLRQATRGRTRVSSEYWSIASCDSSFVTEGSASAGAVGAGAAAGAGVGVGADVGSRGAWRQMMV